MSFLRLPRELRDEIYEYYVLQPWPYHYDHDSGKLTTADKQRIDLQLSYVCKQIASEFWGVALRINGIAFTTAPLEHGISSNSSRFDTIVDEYYELMTALLDHGRGCISEPLQREAEGLFPASAAMLRHLTNRSIPRRSYQEDHSTVKLWSQNTSSHLRFIVHMVQKLQAEPGFSEAASRAVEGLKRRHARSLEVIPFLDFKLWNIPNDDALNALESICSPPDPSSVAGRRRQVRCFSAAALSVRFLRSLPDTIRNSVRSIVLHEEHLGAAHPECHITGLVPFCVANPRLRIERRVDLWHTVLPSARRLRHRNGTDSLRFAVAMYINHGVEALPRQLVTEAIVPWIDEALALPAAGMPSGAFSLIIDSTPDNVEKVVNIVRQDVAWQDALEHNFERNTLQQPVPHPDNEYAGHRGYPLHFSDKFPCKVRDILQNKSCVSFNGATEECWDVQEVIEANQNCRTHAAWIQKWEQMQPRIVEPSPPLPTWEEIRGRYKMHQD